MVKLSGANPIAWIEVIVLGTFYGLQIGKWQKKSFLAAENVLYPDLGTGYMSIYIYKKFIKLYT